MLKGMLDLASLHSKGGSWKSLQWHHNMFTHGKIKLAGFLFSLTFINKYR